MDLHDLLGKSFACACGRRHVVPTEHLIYGPEAMDRLADLAPAYAPHPDYLIVADARTFDAAGQFLAAALEKKTGSVHHFIVPDVGGESPVTDERTRDYILSRAPDAQLYIAAGSGVINDLTKWIAHERDRPFLTFATAASMNGYASANVSASLSGLKVLFQARAPKAVFAAPDIIENAPHELTASGLGDVAAKPVSSADWRLNHFLFDEYYCQFSVDLLKDLEPVYLNQPERIRQRDPAAIQALFQALFYSSVAMTITGTSAPASGGEHLLSHALDMISATRGDAHDLHGRQVGVGTILSAALYDRILALETPDPGHGPGGVDGQFWGPLEAVVAREFKKKRPRYEAAAKKLSSPRNWDQLRSLLSENLVPPEKIKACLKRSGAAHRVCDIRINGQPMAPEFFQRVWENAHQMRERFTVLDLALMLGIMPEEAGDIMTEWIDG